MRGIWIIAKNAPVKWRTEPPRVPAKAIKLRIVSMTSTESNRNQKSRFSNRRKALLLAVVVVAALAWHQSPRVRVGGGRPDNLAARWVKARVYREVAPEDDARFTRLTAQNANGWYGVFREPIQSFQNYQASSPMRPTDSRRTLVLQPLGFLSPREENALRDAEKFCALYFQLPTRIAPALPLVAGANSAKTPWTRRTSRRANAKAGALQWNAATVLNSVLMPRLPADAALYLGVTGEDLWVGELNFVFGIGSFDARCGVFSFGRLDAPHTKTQSNVQADALFTRRACQLLAHESGHLLGLEHCVLYKCVMNGGNSLGDFDATPLEVCPVCERKLQWNIGFDRIKRRRELANWQRALSHKAQAESSK